MKLHYSQTSVFNLQELEEFYYLMKLHYSQTTAIFILLPVGVLLPYEITLFSNSNNKTNRCCLVLLPYEITLFSNIACYSNDELLVLLPYEITLFSNT